MRFNSCRKKKFLLQSFERNCEFFLGKGFTKKFLKTSSILFREISLTKQEIFNYFQFNVHLLICPDSMVHARLFLIRHHCIDWRCLTKPLKVVDIFCTQRNFLNYN